MGGALDLSKLRFGRLTVLRRGANQAGRVMWECVCDCGASVTVRASHLTSGATRGCGCIRQEPKLDLTGQTFGRLKVSGLAEATGRGVHWLCICRCGVVVRLRTNSLTSGNSTSCGCKRRESVTKHGKKHTPEYAAWRSMINRCHRPGNRNYPNYGGRGITVCDQWRNDFARFLEDVGKRPSDKHSLDRIDNDKSYEPGNVRWATSKEQIRNRRNTILVEWNSSIIPLSVAAKNAGITYKHAFQLMRRGRTFVRHTRSESGDG